MAEKAVRKTTKKPAGKAASKKSVSKKASTQKTTRKTTRKTITRKAPTDLKKRQATENRTNIVIWSGIIIIVLVFFASAILGMSDKGKINITTKTNTIKESATAEEKKVIDSIPVQQSQVPDGGLVPSGVPEDIAPKPGAEVTASTTGSTTDALIDSTDDTSVTERASSTTLIDEGDTLDDTGTAIQDTEG